MLTATILCCGQAPAPKCDGNLLLLAEIHWHLLFKPGSTLPLPQFGIHHPQWNKQLSKSAPGLHRVVSNLISLIDLLSLLVHSFPDSCGRGCSLPFEGVNAGPKSLLHWGDPSKGLGPEPPAAQPGRILPCPAILFHPDHPTSTVPTAVPLCWNKRANCLIVQQIK